jgi:hypothetical protein
MKGTPFSFTFPLWDKGGEPSLIMILGQFKFLAIIQSFLQHTLHENYIANSNIGICNKNV